AVASRSVLDRGNSDPERSNNEPRSTARSYSRAARIRIASLSTKARLTGSLSHARITAGNHGTLSSRVVVLPFLMWAIVCFRTVCTDICVLAETSEGRGLAAAIRWPVAPAISAQKARAASDAYLH